MSHWLMTTAVIFSALLFAVFTWVTFFVKRARFPERPPVPEKLITD